MISSRHFLPVALGLFSLPIAVFAQETTATEAAKPETVSVHALIVKALNTNLELRAKRIDPEIQGYRVDGAWGAFDPVLSLGGVYEKSSKPQNYRDFLSNGSIIVDPKARIFEEENIRLQGGISGRLPTGTQLELANTVSRLENTSNRRPVSLLAGGPLYSPEYQAGTTLTITQPLLKDFGPGANLAEVRLAKSTRLVSENELRGTVEKVIAQVVNACFEINFAQENILVKQQAIDLAGNLVRENQRRVDEGRMSPIEVSQSQSRLAEAREELILARNFLAQRQNTLSELTREEFVFDAPAYIIDTTQATLPEPSLNRETLVHTALENNPAYLAAIETAKGEDIRIVYAKNQRLPRVDLRGTLGYTGIEDGWTKSFYDYGNRDTPDWSAGVIISVPLTGKVGKARVNESIARKRQAVLNIKRTEVELYSAIDTALRDISSARERAALVKDSVRFATDSYNAEEKRLVSGLTTSYNVATQMRDFSQTRTRALAADVDLQKAITQLYLVQGVLSSQLKIDISVAP
ncbi:TolC family protein [Rariglobus hedericola]|uniref:TolC family protein n=1 Tax=Rariglobus hedericola TaxID=2597822 RepID=A0A556QIU5_9BACT|nr:TolC family protein [Rariglobus hedericola]TSJ76558.1 TolC family protein [Rariglobus hedericola]